MTAENIGGALSSRAAGRMGGYVSAEGTHEPGLQKKSRLTDEHWEQVVKYNLLINGAGLAGEKTAEAPLKPHSAKQSPPVAKPKTVKKNKHGVWDGFWRRVKTIIQDTATVRISEVTATNFQFRLGAISGRHTGMIDGTARFGKENAVFKDGECQLDFALKGDTLTIKATDDCAASNAGSGVYFNGNYQMDAEIYIPTLTELGVLQNKEQEQAFSNLAGRNRDLFLYSFHLIAEEVDLDNFGATVHSGGVRGAFTFMEAIVMVNSKGKIWAAVIDNEVVRYFTNDPNYATKLPKTIEKWRERFPEKKVVFASDR